MGVRQLMKLSADNAFQSAKQTKNAGKMAYATKSTRVHPVSMKRAAPVSLTIANRMK